MDQRVPYTEIMHAATFLVWFVHHYCIVLWQYTHVRCNWLVCNGMCMYIVFARSTICLPPPCFASFQSFFISVRIVCCAGKGNSLGFSTWACCTVVSNNLQYFMHTLSLFLSCALIWVSHQFGRVMQASHSHLLFLLLCINCQCHVVVHFVCMAGSYFRSCEQSDGSHSFIPRAPSLPPFCFCFLCSCSHHAIHTICLFVPPLAQHNGMRSNQQAHLHSCHHSLLFVYRVHNSVTSCVLITACCTTRVIHAQFSPHAHSFFGLLAHSFAHTRHNSLIAL